MKNLIYISLIIGVVLGCETEEPVSPTPLEPVDTVLEDTTEVYELDTPFNYRTDTAELRSLLLGTWVAFEGSFGGGPQSIIPKMTYTYFPNGVVEFRDIQTDSLICERQYKLQFDSNRLYDLDPHTIHNRGYDTLWVASCSRLESRIPWRIGFENDTIFSRSIYDTMTRYRKLKK